MNEGTFGIILMYINSINVANPPAFKQGWNDKNDKQVSRSAI